MSEEGTEPEGENGENAPGSRSNSSAHARASSSAEPKKGAGRPSLIESLTADQRARFVMLMGSGAPLNFICREVGAFTEDTYSNWRKLAGEGDERYVAFVQEAEQARARHAIANLAMIGKSDDWRARAWLLERLHPKEFAPLQKQEHSGPDGGPIPGARLVYLPQKDAIPEPPDQPADDAEA